MHEEISPLRVVHSKNWVENEEKSVLHGNPVRYNDPFGDCIPCWWDNLVSGYNKLIGDPIRNANRHSAEKKAIFGAPERTQLGKNITGNYFGDAAFHLLGGRTIRQAMDGNIQAQGRLIMSGMLVLHPGSRGGGLGDDIARNADDFAKMFRVQGGKVPNASKQRFVFNAEGNLDIQGDDMLFVTFDDESRAMQFLQNRGEGAELISFNVNSDFVDIVRNNAVPQRLGRLNPGSPQQVDQTMTNNSFGIPKEYFDDLLKSIDQNSIQRTMQ